MIAECECCGKEIPDYKPQMCCSGHECGCRGLPMEPPICSNECWDKVFPPYKGTDLTAVDPDDEIPF